MIVQSARLPTWANNESDLSSIIRMMGYGLPNLDRAIGNAPNRVTLITSGDTYIKAKQADIYRNYSGLNFNNIFQEVIKEEVGFDE